MNETVKPVVVRPVDISSSKEEMMDYIEYIEGKLREANANVERLSIDVVYLTDEVNHCRKGKHDER